MTNVREEERGFSLIEVTVTLFLLTVAMAAFYEMMISASRAGMFSESRNDLAVIGERAVNSMQTEVSQSKLIFEENTIGTGYRTLFVNGLPGGVSVWTNSRLPIIDANNQTFGADPGPNSITNRTGNSLLVARQLAPVAVAYDHDNNNGTADVNFLADRYEFQFYFIRSNSARNFGNFGYYLDLVKARSQVVADYVQLNGVTTNKAQLAARLKTNTGIALAWDPGKAVASGFYSISNAGALSATTPTSFTVTVKSLCPEFAGGRIAGKMEYSLALNKSSSFPIRDTVPLFATANSNFPGGLEVQIVGPSGARKILTRLATTSWYANQFNSQQVSVVTSNHGF